MTKAKKIVSRCESCVNYVLMRIVNVTAAWSILMRTKHTDQ